MKSCARSHAIFIPPLVDVKDKRRSSGMFYQLLKIDSWLLVCGALLAMTCMSYVESSRSCDWHDQSSAWRTQEQNWRGYFLHSGFHGFAVLRHCPATSSMSHERS